MNASSSTDPTIYQFFFSHKKQDGPVTQSLIEIIEDNTENVRYFTSENIEKGTDWRSAIAELLTRSSILVLIFTDIQEDWDWCLYETGFFDSLTQIPGAAQTRRIYCLHNASIAPPSSIANLQSVPATLSDVSQWLEDVFEHTKQTKRRSRENIPAAAGQICRLFEQNGPYLPQSFVPKLTIFLNRNVGSRELVLSARIQADDYALKLLNLPDGRWVLEHVKRAQSDGAWFNELIDNVVAIGNNQAPAPVRHVLRTIHGDFIPTLNRLERRIGQELSLTVDLVKLPEEASTKGFFGRPIASNRWPDIFVAMPFSAELDPIYRDHITKVVAKKMKRSLRRADDFYTNHEIMKDVWSAIYYAEAVIADCTGRNPNVFYEVGIAHTLGKKTILIAQTIDDIPFDVRHIRSLIYEYTPRGMREFERKLEETLCTVAE